MYEKMWKEDAAEKESRRQEKREIWLRGSDKEIEDK